VPALVDTNVLVYVFDQRYPQKQQAAANLLLQGTSGNEIQLPHQAVVEFFAAVTRPNRKGVSLLSRVEALRETEELLEVFTILYPTAEVLRAAIHGAATYQLSWFDAHLWAYAEVYGLSTLISEDFQHGRRYGMVTAFNPFLDIEGEDAL
jgi:predicted nucleic acid-binding protein